MNYRGFKGSNSSISLKLLTKSVPAKQWAPRDGGQEVHNGTAHLLPTAIMGFRKLSKIKTRKKEKKGITVEKANYMDG